MYLHDTKNSQNNSIFTARSTDWHFLFYSVSFRVSFDPLNYFPVHGVTIRSLKNSMLPQSLFAYTETVILGDLIVFLMHLGIPSPPPPPTSHTLPCSNIS